MRTLVRKSMINKILDKFKHYPFLTLISSICIVFLVFFFSIKLRLNATRIDINKFDRNTDIVLEIVQIYSDEKNIYIEGYSYKKGTFKEYDNYVSGKGESYIINNNLILKIEDNYLTVLTTPKYIDGIYDESMNSISYSGFISIIDKSLINEPFELGVIHDNGEYIIIDGEFNYE